MAKLKGRGSGGKGGAAIPTRGKRSSPTEIGPIIAPLVGFGGTSTIRPLDRYSGGGGMKIGRARSLAGQRLGAFGAAWEEDGVRKVGVYGTKKNGYLGYTEYGKGKTFDEAFADAKKRGKWK